MNLKTWLQNLVGGRSPSGPCLRTLRQVRECVDLEYRDATQTLRLSGELVGPKWKQINIMLSGQEYDRQTLDNLVLALRDRGYEFLLFRLGEEQIIPESERDAALAELRALGFQVEVSPDRKMVRQTRTPDARRLSRGQAKEAAPRIMQLVQTVRGVRRPIEVLRKSESALV